ncbi:hypothetical protein [Niveispirillum sp. KHB5.9]|uniref:hypothetical protein n=1 Tax=Niveispirillum sp. KHB5.9 TaxID=3400269 RepID=UPI003A862D50
MTDQTAIAPALKDILARIDRNQAETGKLNEETRKFVAEQHKLMAEANKLRRDHSFAPISILVAVASGSAGLVVAIVSLLKSMGVL